MDDLYVGDYVYYVRVLPLCDVYELLALKLRTVDHEARWFVGYELKTKVSFLFSERDLQDSVFINKSEAEQDFKQKKKLRKERNLTIDCEENN